MSFIGTIIKDLETFASKVESFFAKILGEAPAFEKILAVTLEYVGPVLQTVVSLTAGAPAGALVGKIVATAQQDLAVVSGLTQTLGATPSVQGVLNGVIANLGQILPLLDVKDTKTQGYVALVLKELQALSDAFAPAVPVSAPAVVPAPVPIASSAPAVAAVAAVVADPAPAEAPVVPGLHNAVLA
jgi:hypothetical protein